MNADRAMIAGAIASQPHRSNRSLAVAFGVNHATVGKVRRSLAPERDDRESRDPAEQLREGLTARRREGFGFEDAWRDARAAIEWPVKVEADAWKYALTATRDEWRACYESLPPSALAAQVTSLGEAREWNEHRPVERVAVLG